MTDNSKTNKERASKEVEEPFVLEVSQMFEAYLKGRYTPKTAHDYARDLHHREIEEYMVKNYGCRSVYWLTDDEVLEGFLSTFRPRNMSVSMDGRVKNATMRYREFLCECDCREDIEQKKVCIQRELDFKRYLMARGLTEAQADHDSKLLYDKRVIRVLGGGNHCKKSLYETIDLHNLEVARVMIGGTKVEKDENVRFAISRYIDWIKDMNGEFAKACEVQEAEEHKQVELGQFEERDEARNDVKLLESKLEQKQQEESSFVKVEHEQLIADAFSEIAQKYLERNKRKKPELRTKIKESLHDIMSQLKLFKRIDNELIECIDSFDDDSMPTIPQTIKIGTLIMEQKNGTYIEKVMKGATGAINNNQK